MESKRSESRVELASHIQIKRVPALKDGHKWYVWRPYQKSMGTSLVAQWLGIRLPVQGTQVPSLVRGDPTCHGATKPMRHNYWACALEPARHNYWACAPQQLKPACSRARALQQEKPPQVRSPCTTTKSKPALATTRESLRAATKTQHAKKKKSM